MNESEIVAIATSRAQEAATRVHREVFERELASLRQVQRVAAAGAEEQRAKPPLSDGMWSAEQVAAFLGMSKSWVYERAESGELAAVRLGGRLRFSSHVVREYAQRGEQEAPKVISMSARRRK